MEGSIKDLPTTLPQSVLDACRGFVAVKLYTNQIINPFSSAPTTGIPWDVTPEQKAKYDRYFDILDENGSGIVRGEKARAFFLKSQRSGSELAQIWDISDITESGNLSRDEFAVAMYLICEKITPLPGTLPLSLVPPSLRNRVIRDIPQALSPHNSGQAIDFFKRDLSPTVFGGAIGASQAHKARIEPENSKIGIISEADGLSSMRSQINSLTSAARDLQDKRSMMEMDYKAIMDFSARLEQIKARHESEAKLIKDMEKTLESLQPQIAKLRGELATPEGESFLTSASTSEVSNIFKIRSPQSNTTIPEFWPQEKDQQNSAPRSPQSGTTPETDWFNFSAITLTTSTSTAAADGVSATTRVTSPLLPTPRAPQDRYPTISTVSSTSPLTSNISRTPRSPQFWGVDDL
ncbi:hypothetical protein BGX27_001542 [Mortierella sp. AM989]|nr:hypothetical protein BGX27_001542 [Mortierella sp. AM989]